MIFTFQSQPGSPSQHEDFDFVDVENDMEDFKSRIKKEAGVLEEGNIFLLLHNIQHNNENNMSWKCQGFQLWQVNTAVITSINRWVQTDERRICMYRFENTIDFH